MLDLTPDQVQLVKNTVAHGATDDELKLFLYWCQVNNFDPLKKEAHFTVRKNKCPNCKANAGVACNQCDKGFIRVPAFIPGIGGILSRAARNPNYNGIVGFAVRENDEFAFDAINQIPVKHIFFAKDRGKLMGCWATVYYRDGKKPFSFWYSSIEYATAGGFVSNSMPELMLVTATYSIALRRAFSEEVGNGYSAEEFGGYIEEKTGELILGIRPPDPKAEAVSGEVQQHVDLAQEVAQSTSVGILEYSGENNTYVKVNGAWKLAHQTVAESGRVTDRVLKPFLDLFEGDDRKKKYHLEGHLKKHFGVGAVASLTWEQVAALLACMRDKNYDPRWYADRIKEQQHDTGYILAADVSRSYGIDPFSIPGVDSLEYKFLKNMSLLKDPRCLVNPLLARKLEFSKHAQELADLSELLRLGTISPATEAFEAILDGMNEVPF